MRCVRTAAYTLLALLTVNCRLFAALLGLRGGGAALCWVLAALVLLVTLFLPAWGRNPSRRLRILDGGSALLTAYLICVPVTLGLCIWGGVAVLSTGALIAQCLIAVVGTGALLLAGGLRVLGASVQLGVKWRTVMFCLWWMPVVGYALAWKARRVAVLEYRFETVKLRLNQERVGKQICKTRYPLLLVHGVFFRDSQLLNYWGRIPGELERNGAKVYYGNQQSAASVEDSARELKARIEEIVRETGCQKVNIIAHSKGGLDSRCAISCLEAAPMVASLTTINTPHRGCIFAEKLLALTPEAFQQKLADFYNGALKKLGDKNPDFLAAVRDLTASACEAFNRRALDVPGVLYESVGSYVKKAAGGRFPLNVSYDLVRHYDGPNDGLVAVEAARWGSRFTLLEPRGRRGISHADVIDLGRENIRGFDVREFYVKLVHDLQKRGY